MEFNLINIEKLRVKRDCNQILIQGINSGDSRGKFPYYFPPRPLIVKVPGTFSSKKEPS